jgi:TolA-binding protein
MPLFVQTLIVAEGMTVRRIKEAEQRFFNRFSAAAMREYPGFPGHYHCTLKNESFSSLAARFIFGAMKRQVILCALLAGFTSAVPQLRAQDTPTSPAAVIQRQEADEERYKFMSADIEKLKENNQALVQRLNELRDEIRRLSEELARANSNKDKDLATREDLKRLADKIKEVDDKRISDNEKTLAEISRLGKTLSAPPKSYSPPPPSSSGKPSVEPKTGVTEKGFEYTIRGGDNPRVIAQALAKQGMKITSQQIIAANPSVDWQKLQIKQKIFIPAPTP